DSYTIWDDYWNTGEANQHTQQITANYELPLNKIPFLSFLKSTYSYQSNYNWQRSSDGLSSIESEGVWYNLGNTIQNSNTHQLNNTLNMDLFYKYIGLTQKSQPNTVARPTTPVPGQRVTGNQQTPATQRSVFVDGLIGVVTSRNTVEVTCGVENVTVLSCYLGSVGFVVTSRPTLRFMKGSQDDIRYEAAVKGWLTNYPDYYQNYGQIN